MIKAPSTLHGPSSAIGATQVWLDGSRRLCDYDLAIEPIIDQEREAVAGNGS
jgi:hypothetical protein